MPRDISSSSDDEADDPTSKSPVKQKEDDLKTTRYKCPSDFVDVCYEPCSSTRIDSLKNKNKELWLIKAPSDFNPECLRGIKVPLSGLQNLKVPVVEGVQKTGDGQQVYSILASTHGTADLHLLTSDKKSPDSMVFGPAFSGLLNVFERYGDSGTNDTPHIIPAAPSPSIPPGLKQRFHFIGSKQPTTGAAMSPSSPTFCHPVGKRIIEESLQEKDEERKKKKKKNEKQIKVERDGEEMVRVKVEPLDESQDEVMAALFLQEDDLSGEKRKKKRKKDRERVIEESIEPSLVVKVEEVKCEQTDGLYGDDVESGKKKKKKKKSKRDD